jgi:hypothetical protein
MQMQNPIRAVDLPGVPDLELQGLIVVVGPNSSGKTQFLQDLDAAICGKPRQFVVMSAVAYRPPPPLDEYLEFLIERGSIYQSEPNVFQNRSFQYGADQGGGSAFRKNEVQSQYQQFTQAIQNKVCGSSPNYRFLAIFGLLSCSALFLENRLTLMNQCSSIDFSHQNPSKTLQSIYWDRDAKNALYEEIVQVFRRAVWVDNTRSGRLVLRVSESTERPDAEDRLEPEAMEKYRTIETEGDGLRSYAAICATLLLEQRPLCLIDEPEMCLHPPQAYAIGRFIGKHASAKTCTVVATHSSHILRGILETNQEAEVIRLTRVGSTFQARILTSDLLDQAISKPRSRSEAILEGLLSQAIVMCEAEGDRTVYESVYRTFNDRSLDIRFIPSEGTGGFADPLRLYRILQVPAAVVADLDFLTKEGELKKVLRELEASEDDVNGLCSRAREIVRAIKSCVSHIDPNAIQEKLNALAQTPIDLNRDDDVKLRRELLKAADDLSRLRELQQRGLEAIPEEYDDGKTKTLLRSKVRQMLSEIEELGLFLVPVGELESWLPILMKGSSREDKSRWAMLAAEKVEDAGERDDDVWLFIRTVYGYLDQRLKESANVSS